MFPGAKGFVAAAAATTNTTSRTIHPNLHLHVKVRVEENPASTHEEKLPHPVRANDSVALEGPPPPPPSTPPRPKCGRHCENRPPLADGKYTSPLTKKSSSSSLSRTKGMSTRNSEEQSIDDHKADAVFRPRAVLSSPDNDYLIGYQNLLIEERQRGMSKPSQLMKSPVKPSQLMKSPAKQSQMMKSPVSVRSSPQSASTGTSKLASRLFSQ